MEYTQGFTFTILRVITFSGEKFTFSNPLELPEFYEVFNVFFEFMLFFWNAFQNYASTSNIREVMKFCKLGDESFETDFRKDTKN